MTTVARVRLNVTCTLPVSLCYSNILFPHNLRSLYYRFHHVVELYRFYIHTVDHKARTVLLSALITSPGYSVAHPMQYIFGPTFHIIMYVVGPVLYPGRSVDWRVFWFSKMVIWKC